MILLRIVATIIVRTCLATCFQSLEKRTAMDDSDDPQFIGYFLDGPASLPAPPFLSCRRAQAGRPPAQLPGSAAHPLAFSPSIAPIISSPWRTITSELGMGASKDRPIFS
ncbi:hypothetical protein EV126DRAFT_431983 [Verticillium dahliae]|nr:hypothetical protein EV126DRAFT_431983 [Verticillium dahliae]